MNRATNPAIIDFEKIIQIAIFTGGQSPAMSKKLRMESENFQKNYQKRRHGTNQNSKDRKKQAKEFSNHEGIVYAVS